MNVAFFWRPFALSGFVCAKCHVIIDLDSPGRLRMCNHCKEVR